ncbi:MAG: GNAT family N-acetyltransferase [Chloroflexi bacterium]|nr:GNAT family N-acetyltransferase [Chloroflexota bacterium]
MPTISIKYIILRTSRLIQDNWNILRQDGLRPALRHFWELISRFFYRPTIEYTVFTRPLDDPLPSIEPAQPFTLRMATLDDLERFQKIAPPSDVATFANYLACGRACCLAMHGDNIAAYCWGGDQVDIYLDDLEMHLQPGDVYFNTGYTVPDYRRRGLLTVVYIRLFQHFQDQGCRRAVTIVQVDNLASQGLVRKVGYQPIDQMSSRRILWFRRYRYHSKTF